MSLDVESIPGYKAILKAVIRSQIQLLLDQLCDQGGEESFILMACSGDGVLSQLGSRTGKGFMEGREEIKSQFMGHCLKSQHKKSTESRASPYQRPETSSPHKRMGPASKTLSKHQKVAPSPPTLASYAQDSSHSLDNSLTNDSCAGEDESNQSQDNEMTSTCKTNFPLSLNLNHTQTLASAGAEVHYRTKLSDKPECMENDASIKIEPISDHTDSGQETVDAATSDLAVSDPWTTQQMSSAPSHTDPAVLDSGKFSSCRNQPIYSMLCETRASKDSFIVVQPFPLEPEKDIVSMHAQNDYHQSRDRTNQSSQSYTTLRRMELTPTPSQSSESSADMHVLQTHPVYQTNVQSSAPILTVAPNERIVLPTNIEDQSLPFTRENYGKEKDKWILKRHICHYCGKRCLKPSDLTRHVKIHTGEYSYECPVCRAKFREKFGLAAHTRKGNCSPRM